MALHLGIRVTLAVAVIVLVTSTVLMAETPESEDVDPECATLDFERELNENLNPASLLEDGHYLFVKNRPLPKRCVQMRVCQVNEFTRRHFSQSYYISLNKRGGAEIERQFPDLVETITEGRGDERYTDLNNFCRAFKEHADEGDAPPNTSFQRTPTRGGWCPLNSIR